MSDLLRFFAAHRGEIASQFVEHVVLTIASLAAAVSCGTAMGLWLTRHRRFSGAILGATGVLQTIPSLALLGFLIPFLGIGAAPAMTALFLYGLLPIVRNTFTGIGEVDAAIKEAAVGMGMADSQVLTRVELPLALPVIFAGVRTAAVINVGIATLAALVGAGGLGVFIFRGISLNDPTMILAGALPAAVLALAFDGVLALVQRRLRQGLLPLLVAVVVMLAGALASRLAVDATASGLRVGATPEFMERSDGYSGFSERYGLSATVIELDHGLIYRALAEGEVDAVFGYSTDGEIAAFDLAVLRDDRSYFPPYHVAPLVRRRALDDHPGLAAALERLAGILDDSTMAALNARVDQARVPPAQVASDFLLERGMTLRPPRRSQNADVVIGSKIFAEQYILAELFARAIESSTDLSVRLNTGLGGTKICFDALENGDIDLYPEYTGTGLLAILETPKEVAQDLLDSDTKVYDHVAREFRSQFDLIWLSPLGFNNSYALIVTREKAAASNLESVSDLVASAGR